MDNTTELAAFEEESRRHYNRNFSAGLIHGIFFQMSAAFGSIHTVLPAFLALLITNATTAVGLMAAIQGVGEVIPQLFTAYLIEDKPRKKPYLIVVITIRFISWGILAWLTYSYGLSNPTLILTVLLLLFGLFSLAGGVGTVVYADLFARAIPANKRGRFSGARQLGGFALAILAGWIVRYILGDEATFPFPINYSIIFAFSAISLAIALTGFSLIKEPVYPLKKKTKSLRVMLGQAGTLLKHHANFRTFLLSRSAIGVAIGLAPFYIVHARESTVFNGGQIGLFLTAQMAGAALSNLLWGWMADKYGNKPVILGSILSGGMATLAALIVPLIWPPAYALVFIFVGAMLSGMKIGYSNFILEMAEPTMRATCVALQNTIIIPITALPLVTGILLESFSFSTIFAGELVLLAAGFIVSLKLIDPRHHEEGICVIAE